LVEECIGYNALAYDIDELTEGEAKVRGDGAPRERSADMLDPET